MLLAAFNQYFFGTAIFISSIFLILLVLVQRGRGGGLTGALGGPGGQSAFGTKAGDLFTRITVGVAAVWILLCALSVFFLKPRGLPTLGVGGGATAASSGSLGGLDESESESLDAADASQADPAVTDLPGSSEATESNDLPTNEDTQPDDANPQPEAEAAQAETTEREPAQSGSGDQ